jgi:SERTA motif.
MIDNRASKRRLSDADKNERITLRQMVLNMSMCKLQKRHGRKEPSLLRTVIINNTVQEIEREMDNEMLDEYENSQNQYTYKDMHVHVDDYFSLPSHQDTVDSEQTTPTENPQITTITFKEPPSFNKKENKFGAIGDHRNKSHSFETDMPNQVGYFSGFIWDSLSLPAALINQSGPILDSVEIGNNFTDVDISLYDFDNAFHNKDWQAYPRSCASQYDRRQPDTFFQELDQIMQVLVGM